MAKGTLYLIPSALGETDVTRVLPTGVAEVARSIAIFVVEEPKTARRLLRWMGYGGPLQSVQLLKLNEHSQPADVQACLQPLLEGKNLGMLSEAGCPAVADPGASLVRLAHANGVRVVPLVGPSSILLALMASGLNGQQFAFHGYLPVDAAERGRKLLELERESRAKGQTQILIETPYRNNATLAALLQTCHPATLVCIATDITLDSECIATRPVREWRNVALDLNKRPTIFLLQWDGG